MLKWQKYINKHIFLLFIVFLYFLDFFENISKTWVKNWVATLIIRTLKHSHKSIRKIMQLNLSCFTLFLLFLIFAGSFAYNISGTSNIMVVGDKKFASLEMSTMLDGQTSLPSRASGSGHGPNWDYNWGWGSTTNDGWDYGSGSGRSPTGFDKGFGYGSSSIKKKKEKRCHLF